MTGSPSNPGRFSSVDIAVPRQSVWDLLCDVARYSEFGTITDEVRLVSNSEFGEGSVYTESGKVAGMKSNSEWTVTRCWSVRRFLEGWLGATRCGWWQLGWVVPRQPLRGSWPVMVAA